jgi:hypothetical protein
MSRKHEDREMPTAYVVTGVDGSPPVHARIREALAPIRPSIDGALALFFGLWPIWAVVSLAMLLVWVSAMADSP